MEKEWIEKARAGDKQAFEALARSYEKQIYNLALRMCGHTDDAFDIAQDALFNLYRTLCFYKGDCGFSTWVYRLTSNAAIDFLRKNKRHKRHWPDDDDTLLEACPDYRYEPANAFETKQLREAIEDALTKIKPDYRLVFILRELHGKSYAEIAEIAECEEGTVKSRLFRAREGLRKILTQNGNFPGSGSV